GVRLPALLPVPAHERGPEHRLRPFRPQGAEARPTKACRRAVGARAALGVPGPVPRPAVGRAAAAGGAGPGPGTASEGPAAGRRLRGARRAGTAAPPPVG